MLVCAHACVREIKSKRVCMSVRVNVSASVSKREREPSYSEWVSKFSDVPMFAHQFKMEPESQLEKRN